MEGNVIQVSDLIAYHHIKESFKDRIACFKITPETVNIGTAPAAYMDIFSFIVVENGRLTFEINYRKIELEKGDMLLIHPSLLVRLDTQSGNFEGTHLLCDRRFFEHLLSQRPDYQLFALHFRTHGPVVRLTDRQSADIVQTMRLVAREITCPGPHQEDILVHLMHVSLLQVLTCLKTTAPATGTELNHAEALFQQFVGLVIQHYREAHCIGFYADALCVSGTYLSRVIRQVTGKTVNYFLSGLLFAEACRLLAKTDKPISDIAIALNFADQSSFGKFFKTKAGMSPLTYRTQAKK